MKTPELPDNEEERLAALRSCFVLDTPAEPTFDALTALAQRLLRMPIALLSLVDGERQWFKSRQGLGSTETPRAISFCGHAVASGQLLIIEDASSDERFADNPLVTGGLQIRFYAGAPLVTRDGYALGTLCVIDYVPRVLSAEQQEILTGLAAQAAAHLDGRRETAQLERRLLAAQQAQQAFFEIAVDLLCIANQKLVPEHLNAAWEKLTGRTAEELRETSLSDWIHPEDRPASLAALSQLGQGVASVSFRNRFRHRSGHYVSLAWTITSHQGMFYAVAHDLTALEHERAALTRSEARLRAIFDAVAEGIVISDELGVIEQVNPTMERMSGYSAEELLGQTLTKLTSQRFSERLQGRRESSQAAGVRAPLAAEPETWGIRKDGTKYPILVSRSEFIDRGARKFLGVIRDVTEPKRAEQALVDSETRLRTIIDTAAEAIIIADGAGVIEEVNSSTTRLFGYATEELIGRNLKALMSAGDAEAHDGFLATYARTGRPRIIGSGREVIGQRKDGSQFVAGLAVREFVVAGRTHYAGILRDLTEQKRAQAEILAAKNAAEDASSAKTQFLANMSHEIRTPLNSVLGYATLLLDTPLGTAQQEYVQAIGTAANSLLGQLNAILDLAKIEANKLQLELGPTDLRLAMEDAVEIVAEQARRKNLALTCILSPDCPMHIYSDPGRLRQVLINLVHNAVKFTERGEIVLRAQPLTSDGGSRVLISVRDTGPGFSVETQAKLFQPFSQADASIARRHGGTGLGLSISRRLVEALGGSIGVDSDPGIGTTFWFALPLRAVPPPAMAEPALPDTLLGMPVLVVDEHEASREQLAGILTRLGLRPLLADSAAAAREVLAAEPRFPPGLAMCSSTVPDALPEELVSAIRQLLPSDSLPIIRLQNLGAGQEAKPLPTPTFSSQLAKPLRAHRVARVLHELFAPSTAYGRPSQASSPIKIAPPRADLPAPRILVAEDNPANQRLAKLILQRLGCRVDVVADGQEAVAAASLFTFDAILMDLQMPEMNGLEATQAIRKLPPPTCHIPIVALTANAFSTERERLISGGMDDYLTKPLNFDELQKALQRWLPRHFQGSPAKSSTDSLLPPPSPDAEPDLQQDLDGIRQRMQELSGLLDSASTKEVLALVRKDWPKTLRAAESSLRAGDLPGLCREAHYLAGSALQIGANGLAKQCRALEKAGHSQSSAQLPTLLAAVAQRVFELLTRM